MRTPEVIERLKRLGYTVRQIPQSELPLSMQTQELKGERWFELTICGHQIWNNQDRNGWFLHSELAEFAAKVPEVKQASFLGVVHA